MGIRPPASYEDLVGMDPLPMLRQTLGSTAFDEAVAAGRRLSLEEAIDLTEEVAAALPEQSASVSTIGSPPGGPASPEASS